MNLWTYINENLKNLKLFYKFQIALFLVSTVTLSVMGYFGYTQGRELLTDRSFELLFNITRNKKKAIEAYFQEVKNQNTFLAELAQTRQAIKDFQATFREKTKMDSLEVINSLTNFYKQDFIKTLEYNTAQEQKTNFMPNAYFRMALQAKYLAKNPQPEGFKSAMMVSEIGDNYDRYHANYHSIFLKFAQKFNVGDVILVGEKGDVLYTVAKRVDFADNFVYGVFKDTHVARLHKRIMQGRDDQLVFFQDYEFYLPAHFAPTAWVGTAIYDKENTKKIGTILLQIRNEKITEILTNNQKWAEDGLGTSGETFLVGSDFKLRNSTRRSLEDPAGYSEALRTKVDSLTRLKIYRLRTTVMFREYKAKATIEAINGKEGKETNIDFLGSEVLDVYLPIDILGVRWGIMTEMDGVEIFASATDFRYQLLLIAVGIFIIITIVGAFLANQLSAPMRKIQTKITLLSEGSFPKLADKFYEDELGKIDSALNDLTMNMQNVALFAENIGQKNYTSRFEVRSEKDILGKSLLAMRDSLESISKNEAERNWQNTGFAYFGDLLREQNQNLDELIKSLIAELVKYMKANQGAVFLYNESTKTLKGMGAYAYGKHRYLSQELQIGEGLVGQTFFEKVPMYLTDIPNDYANISSGLGQTRPKCVFLIPMVFGEHAVGVIEIASLYTFQEFEQNFVVQIAQDTATTIFNIKNNEETKRLLVESQKSAQQLRQQEEEMRQNFEELMATQDEMRKRQEQIDFLIHSFREEHTEEPEKKPSATQKNIQDSINRQKTLLDQAEERNRKKEEVIKLKVEKLL